MQAKKINSLLVPAYVEICEFCTASDVERTKPGNKATPSANSLFFHILSWLFRCAQSFPNMGNGQLFMSLTEAEWRVE